ncbi:EscU/YscU/HrcU family type III secretion system export apparatus switch protein [Noviherbaspirillum pedocola]|uniref:EscU/YscU/HrcU family type III secretion system export apparatus switch protein n=1 Tax=Noviherbaspirillum pedocola TaxID=2801341 RepID=A0A934W8D0_9BURK|nr:EscU/YscU/HrcU family type III secretion system export apparatus switch protein [Noviherbaspirillum pedocola]MBK4735684.1 EscU/YscU/HrcU family type III secretion system export apparatus switch protein [Noviherbaspirillum pedocola]
MAEEDQQRSEKATPWKLDQARKKGSVPKGMDLNAFAALSVLTVFLYFKGPRLLETGSRLFAAALEVAAGTGLTRAAGAYAVTLFFQGLRPWAAMFVALIVIGILASLAQTGPVLSFHPIKPDFTRLNPAQGMKRFFNVKLLFDSLRAVLKAALLSTVIFVFLRHALPDLLRLSLSDVRSYPLQALHLLLRLLFYCLLALLPIVLLDIALSRRDFMKRMMMSHREILDEHKQREGDPRIRQRQRALQREARQRSSSLRRVKDADVLITNPTRLAIALKYDAPGMPAPQVLAKGAGQLAALMREMAWRHQVPIVQNRKLAAALFRGASIEQHIPVDCYADVARILIWLRLRRKRSESPRTTGAQA